MRRGTTLIEVLAATVVLALLAAAVVPAVQATGAGAARERERLEAEAWLRTALPTAPAPGEHAVDGHPQWRLVVEDLPPRQRQPGRPLAHTWRRASLHVGGRPLAARLVVVVPP